MGFLLPFALGSRSSAPSRYPPNGERANSRFNARRRRRAWERARARSRPLPSDRPRQSPPRSGRETRALALVERIEERAKAGSLHPFDDRVRAPGKRVKIGGAPDVDMGRMGARAGGNTIRRRGARRALRRRPASFAAHGAARRDLAHQAMRRLVEIVRHLRRERAARLELADQRREQRLVARESIAARRWRGSRRAAPSGASRECRATSKAMSGRRLRAASIMSAELSTPTMRALRIALAQRLRSNCPDRSRCRRRSRRARAEFAERDRARAGCAPPRT